MSRASDPSGPRVGGDRAPEPAGRGRSASAPAHLVVALLVPPIAAGASALVWAHAELAFVTGWAPIANYAEYFVIPYPLARATLVYDAVALGIASLLIGFALAPRGPRARQFAAWAAVCFGLFAGCDLASASGLGAYAGSALVLMAMGVAFVALLLVQMNFAGLLAAQAVLALGFFVGASAEGSALATRTASHAGSLALAAAAAFAVSRAPARSSAAAIGGLLLLGAAALWIAFEDLRSDRAIPEDVLPVAPQRAPAPAGAANVIVIVLDTFRADALDPSPSGNTPALAALAGEARVARRAVSTSNWTLPAHASLFTGTYPTTHGAHFLGAASAARSGREAARVADGSTTLAEWLREHGYSTYGVVANHGYLHADTQIDQGFDVWDDRYVRPWSRPAPLSDHLRALAGTGPLDRLARAASALDEAQLEYGSKRYRLAGDVNGSALPLLDRRDPERPFLLFLNYMDAHAPYIPLPATRRAAGDALRSEWLATGDGPGGVDPDGPGVLAVMRGERDIGAAERAHLEAGYRGEVHDLDHTLAELFEGLRARGLYDDAFLLVTSDHGELLGEHRLLGHSSELYEEAISVPFLLRYPRARRSDAIEGVVQPVDLLPTLAAELGLAAPPGVEGVAIDAIGDRPAVAEHFEYGRLVRRYGRRFTGDRRAFVDAERKLIWYSAHAPELFDLRSDPGEARNLADRERARRAQLEAALGRWLEARRPAPESGPEAGPPIEPSPEERERLESLGYL